jgi:hypothetical protein
MNYLITLFYCLSCIKASGQIRLRESFIDSMLTPLERDSFKRGITPFALQKEVKKLPIDVLEEKILQLLKE